MSIKTKVLSELTENAGADISGAELAKKLNVSRTAVWKAVAQLKKDGINIEAVQNRGYRLTALPDMLNADLIRTRLAERFKDIQITIKEQTDSTNADAKAAVLNGCADKAVFIANEQRVGRGRLGRTFFSPKNGIYLSAVLKPPGGIQYPGLLTTAAAVAVNRAIKKTTDIDTQIKWVNDLFYNGKKVCGILSEAVTDMENGQISSAVIGIGINFKKSENCPDELKEIVTCLFDKNAVCTRNDLIAQILNELLDLTQNLDPDKIIPPYKNKMFLLNQYITYIKDGVCYTALAKDIDATGGLIVTHADGSEETLKTGEVSVRKK